MSFIGQDLLLWISCLIIVWHNWLYELLDSIELLFSVSVDFEHLATSYFSGILYSGTRICQPWYNHPYELDFTMSLQEVIDERVSFLKEQINPKNKPEVNNTFQLQVDAIRAVDIEKVAFIIVQNKALLKNWYDLVYCKLCLIRSLAFQSFVVIFSLVVLVIIVYKAPILEPVWFAGPSGLG